MPLGPLAAVIFVALAGVGKPNAAQGLNEKRMVDLKGRLSNPLDIPEIPVAQGSQRIDGSSEGVETTQIRPSDEPSEGPREEKGRLSNPPQQRLSPTDIDDLLEAYRAGAAISQLAVEFGIHEPP